MSASSVEGRLRHLLGSDPGPDHGVVQAASAWRMSADRLAVIRIGPGAPSSATDGFVLGSVRARADVILTTGANLRAEPELTPEPPVDPATAAALAAWRRDGLGLASPPEVAVLSSGRSLDPGHPILAWQGGSRLLTHAGAAPGLRARVPRSTEVVGMAGLTVRRALEWLLARPGVRTIAVEVGPSTAGDLYRAPAVLDELVLSVLERPEGSTPPLAGELPPPARIEALLGPSSAPATVIEPSGEWSFRRYRRSGR